MKLYADLPTRRTRQLAGDLLVATWVVMWVRVGTAVDDAALRLAQPGLLTNRSATGLGENLRDAGDYLDGVPLVGDGAAVPFDRAAEAAVDLAAAGRYQAAAAGDLALWLGLSVAAVPVLVVVGFYLPPSLRFVRAATAGARFVDSTDDLDLFALRALAHQPLHVLARISDDPAGDWRARDPSVVAALADLELRASGLRPPGTADRHHG